MLLGMFSYLSTFVTRCDACNTIQRTLNVLCVNPSETCKCCDIQRPNRDFGWTIFNCKET